MNKSKRIAAITPLVEAGKTNDEIIELLLEQSGVKDTTLLGEINEVRKTLEDANKPVVLYHPINAPDGHEFGAEHAANILGFKNSGGWTDQKPE